MRSRNRWPRPWISKLEKNNYKMKFTHDLENGTKLYLSFRSLAPWSLSAQRFRGELFFQRIPVTPAIAFRRCVQNLRHSLQNLNPTETPTQRFSSLTRTLSAPIPKSNIQSIQTRSHKNQDTNAESETQADQSSYIKTMHVQKQCSNPDFNNSLHRKIFGSINVRNVCV